MKAIVYTSNTGFTKRYAQLLSERTGLPAYTPAEALVKLEKGAEILYMGWLMAGIVQGYGKAVKRYRIPAVCTVGMGIPSEGMVRQTRQKNGIADARVFCLQGGFDYSKLHGIYKIMMSSMVKTANKKLSQQAGMTKAEAAAMEMLKNGGDKVSSESLAPVVAWLNSRA